MWLDRFSGHSTPSGSPPPHNRSYSPAPRRPSHLGPGTALRPGLSPRSSSFNVNQPNSSTISLNSPRLPNGSGLKQQILPPADINDPVKTLEEIVGRPLSGARLGDADDDAVEKPSKIVEDIEFGGLGLYDFSRKEEYGVEEEITTNTAAECEYVRSFTIGKVQRR